MWTVKSSLQFEHLIPMQVHAVAVFYTSTDEVKLKSHQKKLEVIAPSWPCSKSMAGEEYIS